MQLLKSFEIYEQFLKCQKTFSTFHFQTVNETERVLIKKTKKKTAFVKIHNFQIVV